MLLGMAVDSPANFESSDFYARLGVSKTASAQEIKKAFRALARDHHPDRAGRDPQSAKRFVRIREAYETLSDPAKRERYDRRGQARPGVSAFRSSSQSAPENQDHRGSYAEDLDLDDIFSDRLKGGLFRGGSSRASQEPDFGFGDRETPRPEHGTDIALVVEISEALAREGGSQTLEYLRWVRSDDGRTLRHQHEIFDLRLGPGNAHGDSVRIPRMGNAGLHGGQNGDLVCDLVVLPAQQSGAEAASVAVDSVVVLTIQQALLGGRVRVRCPGGVVMLNVAPCTSSGQRLRIAGKGERGASGARGDHEVRIEIATPSRLDSESRALIEQFAARNSYDPQEGDES